MEFSTYKNRFIFEAVKAGYTENNIMQCLDYAKKLVENKVPIIYNTSHLSSLVGYKKEYLKKAAIQTPYFYRNFEIAKRNGKKRGISEPLPSLKEIQLWILNSILYKIPVSKFAKAYQPKVSLMDNLKFHKKQPKLVTMDIENFFDSIKEEAVETIFMDMGYSKLIANLLAKLCTYNGSLPQGAPTSPCLSNLFFISADAQIATYCLLHKIRYTRYADDLSFSGDFDEQKLIEKITGIVQQKKLKINLAKTKIMTQNKRQVVTGIVVNKKPQVDFNKRNELRQTLYYIQKFGFEEHCMFKNIRKKQYLEHLIGRVNFVLQINPKDTEFTKYKSLLNEIKIKKEERLLEYELFPL